MQITNLFKIIFCEKKGRSWAIIKRKKLRVGMLSLLFWID